MQVFSVIFFLWCISLKLDASAIDQPQLIKLTDAHHVYTIGHQLQYLEDASGHWQIEQVVNHHDWNASTAEVPNMGFTTSAYWFRVDLQNTLRMPVHYLLTIEYPMVDYLDLYLLNQNHITQRLHTGDKLPFKTRAINHRYFIFPITLSASEQIRVYLRLQTTGSAQLPIKLIEKDAFYHDNQYHLMADWLYFGVMLVMILYNFFIFLILRDTNYLFYVLYVTSFTLFQISLNGYTFQLFWPEDKIWPDQILVLFVGFCVMFSAVFVSNFLRVKDHNIGIYRVFQGIFFVGLFVVLSTFFIPYQYIIAPAAASVLLPACAAFVVSVIYTIRGDSGARYFLTAWFCAIAGIICLSLNKLGIIPRNMLTEYSAQIGAAFEVVLLSFALGERFNHERREKYLAQQKAQKKALQAMAAKAESEAKSLFLANMSHEIRTPMSGVIGMSELLQMTQLTEQQKMFVDVISSSGKSLLNIINEILDYSKITAGKMVLEHIPFDLEQVIHDSISLFATAHQKKEVALYEFVDPAIYRPLLGDPTRIRQILLNLMGNAMKFTSAGSVTINAIKLDSAGSPADPHSVRIRLEVVDTGIGISPEAQAQLFQEFSQADRSTSRKFGGTGLGLSISKNLVHLMGGEIGIESIEGEGSTFWVTLATCFDSSPFKHEFADSNDPLPNKRVLVISKSAITMEIIKNYAKKWQMEVNGVASLDGIEGLHIRLDVVDLIILDDTCLTHLDKATADYLAKRPVIVLTDLRTLMTENTATNAAFFSLLKPFSRSQLQRKLNEALGCPLEPVASQERDALRLPDEGKSNVKVLVAEDNYVNQMVIVNQLRKCGIVAEVVEDGQSAVDILDSNPSAFDLVLMDCEMPTMDGFAATKMIRQHELDHNLDPIPIFALTAHALQEYQQRFVAAGMNGHLLKPVELKMLRSLISSVEQNLR